MRKYKLAVIQCDSENDKRGNLDWIEGRIDEAAGQGAQLIASPENMNCMGDNTGEGGVRSEEIPGYTIQEKTIGSLSFGRGRLRMDVM